MDRSRVAADMQAQVADKQTNGNIRGHPSSAPAQEIERFAEKALDLLTSWVDKGHLDRLAPVSHYSSSAQLAERQQSRAKAGAVEFSTPGETVLSSEEELFSLLQVTLSNSVNPWTQRFLDKLYSAPTTLSPAIEMLLAGLNASTAVSSASPVLCLAEEKTVEALAKVLKWNPNLADGLTMPGGSASNVLAVQTALGNAFPSFKSEGIVGVVSDLARLQGRKGKAALPLLLTSEQSHYSLEKAALACGMGMNCVVKIKCDSKGRLDVNDLHRVLQEADANKDGSDQGKVAGFPFFINATGGTTILGAFDDISSIISCCRKNGRLPASFQRSTSSSMGGEAIWIHADCSWGGPVMFSSHSSHLLSGIEQADSLTMNPHKVLNITQQCSFALFRDAKMLEVNVTGAKYLFHGRGAGQDVESSRAYLQRNPGAKTMGCARRGDAFKFYIEWLRVGTKGLEDHVEQGIDYARQVIRLITTQPPYTSSLELSRATPDPIFMQVCFRPKPSTVLLSKLKPLLDGMTSSLTHDQILFALQSAATHTVHERLRSDAVFLVDKAPVHFPELCGYYMRLVTHPNTTIDVLHDVVKEIDRIGQHFFDQLAKQIDIRREDKREQIAYLQQILASADD